MEKFDIDFINPMMLYDHIIYEIDIPEYDYLCKIYDRVVKFYNDMMPICLEVLAKHNLDKEVEYKYNNLAIYRRSKDENIFYDVTWEDTDNHCDYDYYFINYEHIIVLTIARLCLSMTSNRIEYEIRNFKSGGNGEKRNIHKLVNDVKKVEKYWSRVKILWEQCFRPISKIKSARSNISK